MDRVASVMNPGRLEIPRVGGNDSLTSGHVVKNFCLQAFSCCLEAKCPPAVTEAEAWNMTVDKLFFLPGHEDSSKVVLSPSLAEMDKGSQC